MTSCSIRPEDIERARDVLRSKFHLNMGDEDDPIIASYILGRMAVDDGANAVEERIGSLLLPVAEILTALTPVMERLDERERRLGWLLANPWILFGAWLASIIGVGVLVGLVVRT